MRSRALRDRFSRLLPTLLLAWLPSSPAMASQGLLKVTSFPSGAVLFVDGVSTGRQTPALIVLEEGPHVVTVQRTGGGWEPVTRTLTIARGRNDLDVTLVPLLTDGSSCWDLNENQQCDLPSEDSTGDGKCTPADCQGAMGEPGREGAPGAPGTNGSSCRVVQEPDGATIQCEDGSSARVFDGVPGPAGSSLAGLAYLLGLEPSSITVPPEAIQPAECASAWVALSVGGASLGEVFGLVGEEEISRLSRYAVAVRMDDAGLDLDGLVGGAAQLSVRARDAGGSLDISGIVTEIGLAGVTPDGALYVVVLEPALARLERSRGFASFSEKSVPDIVGLVLDDGSVDSNFELVGSYPAVPFEMQYDETDFDFVNRLMEEEGISYFFAGDGTMVAGDDGTSFSNGPSLPYIGHFVPPSPAVSTVSSFRANRGLVSSTATVSGFDPGVPASVFGSASAAGGIGEIYRFFPEVTTAARASQLARVELERARVAGARHQGTSNAPDLRAGSVITITGPGVRFSGSYLVTKVTHVLTPGDAGGACFAYGNEFSAIPAAQSFRPSRHTPSPRVKGVLSALVDEVDAQQYRVKVRFPWIRTGEGESNWIRVGYPPGRKSEAFLPEVGDEVIVEFVGGDVNEPIVIGGLWNGSDPPPSR